MSFLDIVGLILIMIVRISIRIAVVVGIVRIVCAKKKAKTEPDFYDFLDFSDKNGDEKEN